MQRGISVVPLTLYVTGPTTRLALWMLTAAVSFVLLMAIANIAGLSLARSAGRDREIAIRSALGASQVHIVRQLLIESVTLAVISGLASLLVAFAGIRLILSLKPAGLARLDEVAPRPVGIWLDAGAVALSGILIGLAPAITTTAPESEARVSGGRTRRVGRRRDAPNPPRARRRRNSRWRSCCSSAPVC